MIRSQALKSLWQWAARSIEFRHPDRKCRVEPVVVELLEAVEVRLVMHDMRDTENPNVILKNFWLKIYTGSWPGYEVARLAMVGVWIAYISHEAMELTIDRDHAHLDEVPWYPHYENKHCPAQNVIDRAWHGWSEIKLPVSFVIGPEHAEAEITAARERADKELRAEMDWGNWYA